MDSHHCPKTEALDAVVIVQEKKKHLNHPSSR